MPTPLRVLHIEDSELDGELVAAELVRAGYDLVYERVATAPEASKALERLKWDVVLCDHHLPALTAARALELVRSTGRDVPFLIVSGTITEDAAVETLKAGAHDFITKDRLARLGPSIERERRDVLARQERQQLAEQLRQAQKMEAIGRLAGGIAHDFNNVLTAILGYTELLTDQIGVDKPLGRDLHQVHVAAQRAAELTRQLLAFSRKQVFTLAPINLTTIVQSLEPMLRRLIGERVTIRTTLSDDLPPVLADRNQLEHVLVNLSVNARDAMPNGGALAIATGRSQVDSAAAAAHPEARVGAYAWLRVSDTGTGIAPELQSKIFEPFFTTKDVGQGTGLGLAAVYGTIQQLGGYITVDSVVGQGSTFTVYIPVTEEPTVIAAPVKRRVAPVGNETILVVEDEGGVRAFVVAALSRFGYRVLAAESAEAALDLLAAGANVDLLVADMVLPGIDGLELATMMRKRDPALPVLCMSGYSEKWVNANAAGGHGLPLLEKPFSPQSLLAKVRELLEEEVAREG